MAGLSKGALGMGFPLISVPIVASVTDPRFAVVLISIPNAVGHLPILLRGNVPWRQIHRLWPVLACAAIGALIGTRILAIVPPWVLAFVLGTVTLTYVAMSFLRFRLSIPPKQERFYSPVIGLFSGALLGATGSAGTPITLYLHSLKFPKWDFVYVQTMVYAVANYFQIIGLFQNGLFTGEILGFSVALIAPALVGLLLGLRFHDRVNPELFSRLVLLVLGLTGVQLLIQGLRH